MKKQTKKIIIIVLLGFLGLFIWRFLSIGPSEKKSAGPIEEIEKFVVKVASVKKENLDLVLSYVGNIKAKDESNVFSKVTGKLAEYTVTEGDYVEKGQVIAFVDRDETGLKYELAKVESPISGIVGRTLLDKGASVLPTVSQIMGTALAIVVNMDEMIVRLNVPESDIPYLKRGLKAKIQVDAYPQDNFEGEVSKVSEVVDIQTRTLPIEITISNQEHRLKSGMFARIKIIAAQLNDRLTLSQDALVQEFGETFVFTAEDNTAKKKRVVLGARQDSKVEIVSGLTEGQRVIVFGQQGLKDGSSVEIAQE